MTNKYIKIYYQLTSILQIIPVYKMLGSKKKKWSYKRDSMIYTINFLFSRGQKFKKKTLSFVEFILATIIYEPWNFHGNVRDESEVMNIHSTDCYTIQKKNLSPPAVNIPNRYSSLVINVLFFLARKTLTNTVYCCGTWIKIRKDAANELRIRFHASRID